MVDGLREGSMGGASRRGGATSSGSPQHQTLSCYDVPGLPRTKNALESHFRETRRRLLRITSQKGLTQRMLQRQGAWYLLPGPATEAQLLDTVGQTPAAELAQE